MRVLWFAVTPSLYDEKKHGGWIASLERIIRDRCPEITLGIAFEHPDTCFKKIQNNVIYYPLCTTFSCVNRILIKFDYKKEWEILKPECLKVIKEFKPDIIQCFGSEWFFPSIAKEVSIPVLIHMQGFTNVYNLSSEMAMSIYDSRHVMGANIFKQLSSIIRHKKQKFYAEEERDRMRYNKYFLGRTEWDKNIVTHYNADAHYFYCPEAIRPEIYNAEVKWSLPSSDKLILVTITQAGRLKGNEIILRTADILKNQFGMNFEWRVAGDKSTFMEFERKTGLSAKNVNIKLLGMIDVHDIINELVNAHMYIHPAIIDNSPNSLCEAQLIGCPVIAANVGGIPQLVENNKTGVLYPYNEPYTLSFKIIDLYKSPATLIELSKNEIQIAKKRHDPQKIADIIFKIYSDCIADYANH